MLSKMATCNSHGEDSNYFLGWEEYEKNPYDKSKNPSGIIQMGLAENQLSFDLLESWLQENPNTIHFKGEDGNKSIFQEVALFQDYRGLPAFKNALAEFMSEIRGNAVSFDPNNLVLTAGATSANETIMFCLANPGEAFLLPTPYYPGFDRDLKWRTGAEIVPIQCSSSNGFKITEFALEEAYHQAKKQNIKVNGVFVTNPSNPLGTSLTLHELNLLITFVSERGIHLVSDEIYSGTVFRSRASLVSWKLLRIGTLNTRVANQVHIVYSLSKDLGVPGFRVRAIYSNDKMVVEAATKMSSFGLISSQTQYLFASLLSDKKFTRNYIPENQRRLKKRHELLVSGLKRCGINCLESNAGLFCWVDMRHLLSSSTFEAEIELWKKIVYNVRLNISPGSSCHCSEPGWFRICFPNTSEETLIIAMQRIKSFIDARTTKNISSSHHQHQRPVNISIFKLLKPKWVFGLPSHNHEAGER